ncbi:hypothetical protein [Thermus igniterrae]|jgi:hypothetical protein|uniref:hypothetical protein n=1 Tax=Thermus igniterrae TaxID=88189 RepID=UPI000382D25C|nr:hypothetical protein [Thermus igniterrae]
MKRPWLLLFLLYLLYACTGSQETPLPALVAAGGNGEMRFYRARDLQGGSATPVATWTTPGLVDLAYGHAQGRLFLLFPDRVEAYGTQGFTENAAPQPPPAATFPLDPGTDCTGGYLRQGEGRLLVHCPGAGRAFLLGLPDLTDPLEADLTGLPPGVRLALWGQDLLAYLTESALGYRPPANPQGTPRLEKPLGLAGFTPGDLRSDPGRPRLLGAGRTLTEPHLLRLEGDALSIQPLGLPSAPLGLALDPVAGLVAYGLGFRVLEPRDSGAQRTFFAYGAGLVGQDAYLYLAQGSTLEVYDLQQNPFPTFPQASANLGFSPRSLAFLPVE